MLRATGVTVSSKDVGSAYGFAVERPGGVLNGQAWTFAAATTAGRLTRRVVQTVPTPEARDLILTGTVIASSVSALMTQLDGLKRWCANGEREIACEYDTTRMYRGRLVRFEATGYAPDFARPEATVTATFRCEDPFAIATSDTTVNVGTSATSCALGSAESYPVITVTGVHTNITLTLKNAAGTTLETMAFTLALVGGGDTLVIDCDRRTVQKTVSSVTTNAIDALSNSGNAPTFLTLDPNDGDQDGGTWPTLQYSVSAGTPTVQAVYRKRWL
jgi:phage-related protein